MKAQRITFRKALIEDILINEYGGGPVLLEELRWKVLIRQYGPSFVEMSDAKRKSFTRTIRNHLPLLTRRPIGLNRAPVGVIARAALYRIKSTRTINSFLAAANKHVRLNIGFPDHNVGAYDDFSEHELEETRSRHGYLPRITYLRRVTVGVYFSGFEQRPHFAETVRARIIIPKSQKLILIESAAKEVGHSESVTDQTAWKIYYENCPIGGGRTISSELMSPEDVLPFWKKRS